MTVYHGRTLSGSYADDAERLLQECGVAYETHQRKNGWRTIRFAATEIPKLPQDGTGAYIPVGADEGFSFWKMTDKEWNED